MAAVPPHPTLGDLAQGAIAKYLKQIVAYRDPVLADTDPENLHQMRVSLRRLRTALQLFDRALKLPKAGREDRVARLGRALGALRDLDVIGLGLRDRYAPDLPDAEQQSLVVVQQDLARQRQRSFKRTQKLLTGKPYTHLTETLGTWVVTPTWAAIPPQPAQTVVADLALPLVSQLWLHPGWLVGTLPTPSGPVPQTDLGPTATDRLMAEQGPQLHSLRKQVKRVRYQLRLVADLYPNRLVIDLQRLSAMQDALGDLQDSTVLEAFLGDALPVASTQLPTLVALLADRRHRAWQRWQTHQRYYLDPEQRQRLRLALLHPGPPSSHGLAAAQGHQPVGQGRTAQGHCQVI
jgi:CHAD domain-containing protein